MEIKITTTLSISEANLALIPLVASDLGYQAWVESEIQKAQQLAIENETEYVEPDTSVNAFIKVFFKEDFSGRIKGFIKPSVTSYFGKKEEQTANYVIGQLETAVTTDVTIS